MPAVKNPAGWDANAITDYLGAAILVRWLASDSLCRFRPDISTNDKTPNFDGYIEFGEPMASRVVPCGRVHVQVKSTAHMEDFDANGIARYSCKTEVFRAVSQRITCDPVALVIVDVMRERCFWKDLTQKYIDSLQLGADQKRKIIKLEQSDVLVDHDAFLRNVSHRYREVMNHLMGTETGGVVTIGSVGQERLSELQRAYAYMADCLATNLRFLKELSFLDTWTISLGYGDIDCGYVLAIIPVRTGEDMVASIASIGIDATSPMFGFTLTGNVHTDPPLSRTFPSDYPVERGIKALLLTWVETFAESQVIHPRFMSETMLAEAMFFCADLIAEHISPLLSNAYHPSLFVDDELTPALCRRLYDACHRVAVDEVLMITRSNPSASSLYYVELFGKDSLLGRLATAERIARYYNSPLAIPSEREFRVCLREDTVPFSLMNAVIKEIEARELVVRRPWKYSRGDAFEVRRKSFADERPASEVGMPFDLNCARSDYVDNYTKLVAEASVAALDLERRFFGVEDAWDEHAYTLYALGIGECYAVTSNARYRGCGQGYELEILPSTEEASYDKFPKNANGGELCACSKSIYPPKFCGGRPLYLEVLRRMLKLIHIKCPEAKLKEVRSGFERKREMSGAVSLDGSHVLVSGGLTEAV